MNEYQFKRGIVKDSAFVNVVRYRLYTEDKDRARILAYVSKHFPGFSVFNGISGYWNGIAENSIVIEILTPELIKDCRGDVKYTALELIQDIVSYIKVSNVQESVAVTRETVETSFTL